MVRVRDGNSGTVRFANCAFWGPCKQIAKLAGEGTTGFSDCTFVQWDRDHEGLHAIQAGSGSLLVTGCEFKEDKPQIEIGENVRRAVIANNLFAGKPQIVNQSKIVISPDTNAGH